jgi:hypothetical protein
MNGEERDRLIGNLVAHGGQLAGGFAYRPAALDGSAVDRTRLGQVYAGLRCAQPRVDMSGLRPIVDYQRGRSGIVLRSPRRSERYR